MGIFPYADLLLCIFTSAQKRQPGLFQSPFSAAAPPRRTSSHPSGKPSLSQFLGNVPPPADPHGQLKGTNVLYLEQTTEQISKESGMAVGVWALGVFLRTVSCVL